jgi:hypothetical protein
VLHEAGNFSGRRSEFDRAVAYLDRAVKIRKDIKDYLGAYMPLRPGYDLQILKNGAIRYARSAEAIKGK